MKLATLQTFIEGSFPLHGLGATKLMADAPMSVRQLLWLIGKGDNAEKMRLR